MRVTLEIDKNDVFKEVNGLTSYIGSRSVNEGENAFERVSTTDSDSELLDMFWRDACSEATDLLRNRAIEVDADNDSSSASYEASIVLDDSNGNMLRDSIQDQMRSFFINYIAGKWLSSIGSASAMVFLTQADACLSNARWKIYPRILTRKQNPF